MDIEAIKGTLKIMTDKGLLELKDINLFAKNVDFDNPKPLIGCTLNMPMKNYIKAVDKIFLDKGWKINKNREKVDIYKLAKFLDYDLNISTTYVAEDSENWVMLLDGCLDGTDCWDNIKFEIDDVLGIEKDYDIWDLIPTKKGYISVQENEHKFTRGTTELTKETYYYKEVDCYVMVDHYEINGILLPDLIKIAKQKFKNLNK